tara:strand:+ start:427 stop:2451 length:2025 start_codon:yes stop_codon:yes gene_type:complete
MNIKHLNANGSLYYKLKQIIESKLGQFPEVGIVAGQAVSSALMVHLGIGEDFEKPFNDVDIFVTNKIAPHCPEIDSPEPIFNEQGQRITFSDTRSKFVYSAEKGKLEYGLRELSFSCELVDPTYKNNYHIDYSHRDAGNSNLNYIRIKINDDYNGGMTPLKGRGLHVLAGFDINACQIALDTASKTVVWTPEFEEFIETLELKASFLGTPMHTAVRLFKKHAELPFLHFNKNYEMLKLQSAREVFIHLEKRRGIYSDDKKKEFMPGNLFSAAYLPKIEAVKDEIAPYFELEEKVCKFENHFSVESDQNEIFRESHTDIVERKMYVFKPLNHNEACVRAFIDATIGSNGHLTCENVNRLFGIWFDAFIEAQDEDREIQFLNFASIGRNTDDKHRLFVSTWFRAHINDGLDAVLNTGHVSIMQAFHVYKNQPKLFELLLSKNISVYEIVKIAKNVLWLIDNKMGYYIGLVSDRHINDILGCCSSVDSSLNHSKKAADYALKKAIAKHVVSFDHPNFKELMLEKRKEFLFDLKKVKGRFTECDVTSSNALSYKGFKVALVNSAFELFQLYVDSVEMDESPYIHTRYFIENCSMLAKGNGLFVWVKHPTYLKPLMFRADLYFDFENAGNIATVTLSEAKQLDEKFSINISHYDAVIKDTHNVNDFREALSHIDETFKI